MPDVKHHMIIEAKLPTGGKTKTERNAMMKKFFTEAQKCMKHHADKNGRETFIILITAAKADEHHE